MVCTIDALFIGKITHRLSTYRGHTNKVFRTATEAPREQWCCVRMVGSTLSLRFAINSELENTFNHSIIYEFKCFGISGRAVAGCWTDVRSFLASKRECCGFHDGGMDGNPDRRDIRETRPYTSRQPRCVTAKPKCLSWWRCCALRSIRALWVWRYILHNMHFGSSAIAADVLVASSGCKLCMRSSNIRLALYSYTGWVHCSECYVLGVPFFFGLTNCQTFVSFCSSNVWEVRTFEFSHRWYVAPLFLMVCSICGKLICC